MAIRAESPIGRFIGALGFRPAQNRPVRGRGIRQDSALGRYISALADAPKDNRNRPTHSVTTGQLARLPQDDDAGRPASKARQLRLPTELPSAADTEQEIRTQSQEIIREPFTIRLTVTATGRAEIAVSARLPEDQVPWITRACGVMLVPVRVVAASGETRYFLPLRYSDGAVSGRLNIAVPPGDFVEADLAGPPLGGAETSLLDAADVERSIHALPTRSARVLWQQLAALLPSAHPLRAVIARESQ